MVLDSVGLDQSGGQKSGLPADDGMGAVVRSSAGRFVVGLDPARGDGVGMGKGGIIGDWHQGRRYDDES
jgi:hypothetical protein